MTDVAKAMTSFWQNIAAFDWESFGWALAISVGITVFVVWDQWPRKESPPDDTKGTEPTSSIDKSSEP